jgi:hypothetical protein
LDALKRLPPQERRELLERSPRFNRLPPAERQRLLNRLDRPRRR